MTPSSNVRRAAAALVLMLAAASLPASQVQDDEHPFIMPGTPAKTVPAPAPWFTGAQLLKQLAQGDAGAVDYLKGVYDATESGLWCYTSRQHVKLRKQTPEVMRADAMAFLRKLPAAQQKDRASDLLVRMWQIRWPCPPDGCCT
ncbi:MAG: Rap1a/Tai family immunity protein [Telluria sp.]